MKNWFRRRGRAAEIHEEIESHLAMRAELNRESGTPPDAARTSARRQFGNAALIEEDVRRVRGFPWLESLGQDAGYAFRGFVRAPVFTATAVLTIALGIGAGVPSVVACVAPLDPPAAAGASISVSSRLGSWFRMAISSSLSR